MILNRHILYFLACHVDLGRVGFVSMKMIPILLFAAVVPAFAHPDDGVKPGPDHDHAYTTGNGEWVYDAVPGWGVLPDGEKIGPTHGGVVIGPDGRVYVSTDSEKSVLVWEEDGTFVKTIAPECQGFHAMAIRQEEGKAVIYGAQLKASPPRICKIDTDGKLLLEIPNAATAEVPGSWKGLTAVTVAPDGSIFAGMGYGSQMMHKFDAAGKLLKSFGGPGKEDGQFRTCHGMAIDERFGDVRLLVADRENRRLCHLTLEGEWIGVHATHLRRPCTISILGDHVAVAELEARVTILDKNGAPISFLGDNPNRKQWANFKVAKADQSLGIFTAPHGLSFAPNGDLYVQDWNETGRVTKLKKR